MIFLSEQALTFEQISTYQRQALFKMSFLLIDGISAPNFSLTAVENKIRCLLHIFLVSSRLGWKFEVHIFLAPIHNQRKTFCTTAIDIINVAFARVLSQAILWRSSYTFFYVSESVEKVLNGYVCFTETTAFQ